MSPWVNIKIDKKKCLHAGNSSWMFCIPPFISSENATSSKPISIFFAYFSFFFIVFSFSTGIPPDITMTLRTLQAFSTLSAFTNPLIRFAQHSKSGICPYRAMISIRRQASISLPF
ncbi:hypothetical protein IEQ34_005189 [Dendrobium chrysotoxum]|uniref:Uncharacterized protein n=1 Tax=Dendrobium chrysotoxum TaxID=161865 RepID=A0AAV7H858_DENCH|nr:hypothetical protein IEQ34_005189 [Dendrobium chrysotoxum]